ncbi:MAG: VCBS repeat-containing protein [Pyrinomonadaceae bacterium]
MHKRVFTVLGVLFTLAVTALIWSSFPQTTLASEKTNDGSVENAQPQAVFTNSAPITILDNSPASLYPSTISVSGIIGSIPTTPGSVKVTLNGFSHTWPDDVAIVLVGPTGAALLLQSGAGDDPNMVNVTYTISDTGATLLPNATAWPAGTYKPTTYFTGDDFPPPGPGTTYSNPGPAGAGTATFSSTFGGTNANGDWKLYVIDEGLDDVGSINGGWSLEIVPSVPINDAPVDMNGDGKTDFVVLRNTGGGVNGQVTWRTSFQDGFPTLPTEWGIASDQFIPADFDGDSKDDFAVFRPGTPGRFYIVRSASATLFVQDFGTTGDDSSVVGDYTGDGIDDMALYRAGANPGNQSFWFYRSMASSQNFETVAWGVNGDFVAPGDYDGDGKYDFVIQRPDSNGVNGRFFIREADGPQRSELFGLADDLIVPGDYDDDGKTDLAVVTPVAGFLRWNFEPSGTAGSTVVSDTWGQIATGDIVTQGDYDGDGKTEYSVWRPGTPSVFYMMTVGTRLITTRNWGEPNDVPAANYNVH